MTMYTLLLLVACAPKTSPEDQAFARAQGVVAAFAAGELAPLSLEGPLEVEARSSAYMGEYVWEMYAATAAARRVVEPLLEGDPRYSGKVMALPAPQDASCCFDVHFLAEVAGETRSWVVARAGWEEGVPVAHDLASGLPEAAPPSPVIAERLARLDAAADLGGERLVVALADLTGNADDRDIYVYSVPSVADDQAAVGLVARVWTRADAAPRDVAFTISDRTWPRAELRRDAGLFLSATGRVPSHAHIFASRRYGVPLWVDLETGLWRVEGSGVGLFATPAGKP